MLFLTKEISTFTKSKDNRERLSARLLDRVENDLRNIGKGKGCWIENCRGSLLRRVKLIMSSSTREEKYQKRELRY